MGTLLNGPLTEVLMSKTRLIKQTCEKCHKEFEYDIFESVNVTLDPELREKVLSGEIYKVVCPHCGEVEVSARPLLYHDMDKKFMIYANTPAELLLIKDTVKNNQLAKEFPKLDITKDYTICGATGHFDLVTKITALEAGLDWRVATLTIHLMIYHLKKQYSEEHKEELEVNYSVLIRDDDNLVMIVDCGKDKQFNHIFPMDFYEGLLQEFKTRLDDIDPFFFNDDSAHYFMEESDVEKEKLESQKRIAFIAVDTSGNKHLCVAPDYLESKLKEDDVVVIDELSGDLIKKAQIIKKIEFNDFNLPYGLYLFETIPFEFNVPKFDKQSEGISEEETKAVLDILNSYKDSKVTFDSFPSEQLEKMNVYVASQYGGNISFPFLDGEFYVPGYLREADLPDDEASEEKPVYKLASFNDLVRFSFLMSFNGIVINPYKENVIITADTLRRYPFYRAMKLEGNLFVILESLKDDEIRHMSRIVFNVMKDYAANQLSYEEIGEKYKKEVSVIKRMLSYGHARLSEILTYRFMNE